jgi:hypothetical protein
MLVEQQAATLLLSASLQRATTVTWSFGTAAVPVDVMRYTLVSVRAGLAPTK